MASPTIRRIVKIDESKCNGCGLCVPSCAEGAIEIIDGKARLVADNLCDGLGNCLGECPEGAITVEDAPAAEPFDPRAVIARRQVFDKQTDKKTGNNAGKHADTPAHTCGCPGTMLRKLNAQPAAEPAKSCPSDQRPSALGQWPVQLTLLPVGGDIWKDADVLIAADCVAFAMNGFHEEMLAGKTLAIACPKLDDVEPYISKLTQIFAENEIHSITVVYMEVPCCLGLVRVVEAALQQAGRSDIEFKKITVGINGRLVG